MIMHGSYLASLCLRQIPSTILISQYYKQMLVELQGVLPISSGESDTFWDCETLFSLPLGTVFGAQSICFWGC